MFRHRGSHKTRRLLRNSLRLESDSSSLDRGSYSLGRRRGNLLGAVDALEIRGGSSRYWTSGFDSGDLALDLFDGYEARGCGNCAGGVLCRGC